MKDIPPLYHYSGASGLLGIVKSKCLWMSNIHYQNDADEYYHALRLIKNVVDTEYQGLPLLNLDTRRDKIYDVFTFSLTEEKDLLSQWRGYCPSGGFSFRFNENQLTAALNFNKLGLHKVIYTEEEKIKFIKNTIIGFSPEDFRKRDSIGFENPASVFGKNATYSFSKSAKFLMRRILNYAPLLKDESFEREKEWRVVTIKEYSAITIGIEEILPNALLFEVKFRDRGSLIIPYLEVPLASNDKSVLIDELIIGPSHHQELSAFSLKLILGEDVLINSSATSYRYW